MLWRFTNSDNLFPKIDQSFRDYKKKSGFGDSSDYDRSFGICVSNALARSSWF